MSTLCAYSLQPRFINQYWTEYEWIRVIEFQYYWLTHNQNYMSSEELSFVVVVRILIATYTYKSTVKVCTNEWFISIVVKMQYRWLTFKISWALMSSEKTIHYWTLLQTCNTVCNTVKKDDTENFKGCWFIYDRYCM